MCCCMNCEERTVGCHGSCEAYKEWADEQEKARIEIKTAKYREAVVSRTYNFKRFIHPQGV